MHDLLTIYLPAAIVAVLISGLLARHTGHKNLLYVGIYCIIVPVVAALVAGGIGRWSVVISNSVGLLLLGLVLWLSRHKRESVEGEDVGEAAAE